MIDRKNTWWNRNPQQLLGGIFVVIVIIWWFSKKQALLLAGPRIQLTQRPQYPNSCCNPMENLSQCSPGSSEVSARDPKEGRLKKLGHPRPYLPNGTFYIDQALLLVERKVSFVCAGIWWKKVKKEFVQVKNGDEQKLWRTSQYIPSYVASFFSLNLSYVLKKTNFGLVSYLFD